MKTNRYCQLKIVLAFFVLNILSSMAGHTSNQKSSLAQLVDSDLIVRNSVRLRPIAACNLPFQYLGAIGEVDSEELMTAIISADVPPGVSESDFYFRADGLYLHDELIAVFCDVRGRSQ